MVATSQVLAIQSVVTSVAIMKSSKMIRVYAMHLPKKNAARNAYITRAATPTRLARHSVASGAVRKR